VRIFSRKQVWLAGWQCAAVALLVVVLLAGVGRVCGQALTDLGASSPVPGANDQSQLSTTDNQTGPDGLNYYTDNQSVHNAGEPGQVFTTGGNAAGYVVTSVALKTSGLGNDSGIGTAQPYYLHLYFVADGVVVPIETNTSASITFSDGDWLQWTGLSVPLAPHATYAWSFGKASTTSSYEALAVASGNMYTGGQIGLFYPGGGPVTYGSSGVFDAVFDVGLATNVNSLRAGTPVVTPAVTNYYGGPITLTAAAAGAPPLYFQWQMGGSSGVLTNLPNATNTSLTLAPPGTNTFRFDFVVTNTSGSVTSSVVAVTTVPPVLVTVAVAQPMFTMAPERLGVNTATYDNELVVSSIAPLLKAAGITGVRYPGGSYADVFNWANTTGIDGAYVNGSDSFISWMNTVVNPAGAQAVITVNYGSNPANTAGGDTNLAAAWVACANITNHWGVKYWEIGNEVGGNGYYGTNLDWEYDLHYPETNASTRVGQPALSPAAYGTKDPTIKCGVGFDTGNATYNSQLLGVCGSVVDFVIIHWYPGGNVLADPAQIPGIVSSTYTQLTNIVGAAHAGQMKIAVTETGAGTATGAVVALFTADDFLSWLELGSVNVDYEILHNDILQANQKPGHAYYGAMMAHLLAGTNDTFVKATSSQSSLRVHASSRQDGKTGVLLINTDPALTVSATVSISGLVLATTGTAYQFGLTNFIGANDYPSYPVATNAMSGLGNQFTLAVPPYTMLAVLIPAAPTNTPPGLAPIVNQTVNPGQKVTVTARATDTNQPTPTLTFSMLSGPAGSALAQINNTNATVNWRPLVTQGGTTNVFNLKVADNGGLSATQNFTVTVNPFILPVVTGVAGNQGQLALTVSGQTGPDYAVQSSTNLGDWTTVFLTNAPVLPVVWTTNVGNLPVQFFRIQTGPPGP